MLTESYKGKGEEKTNIIESHKWSPETTQKNGVSLKSQTSRKILKKI